MYALLRRTGLGDSTGAVLAATIDRIQVLSPYIRVQHKSKWPLSGRIYLLQRNIQICWIWIWSRLRDDGTHGISIRWNLSRSRQTWLRWAWVTMFLITWDYPIAMLKDLPLKNDPGMTIKAGMQIIISWLNTGKWWTDCAGGDDYVVWKNGKR